MENLHVENTYVLDFLSSFFKEIPNYQIGVLNYFCVQF